ncbi:COBRA-like protein 10 precursor [Actinidia rufa]|uniref:COBRA-like protein 10 n=1 Tax=Actinidia rufa TaxID=165716 RepID=A0A7J0GP16_9ERIC|nr:COBRA-like protein 10 precursor [Actinidia rufa]
MPPDLNRTAIYPPQRWKINGVINPDYKCGPPVRIDSTEFPDPSGLAATSSAVATWQVTCNITRPKPKQARCCVSFSAYYAEAAVPCSTCACGCERINNMRPGCQCASSPARGPSRLVHCDPNKKAFPGYENVYSFNGTALPHLNDTIFFTGLKGLNYLVGEVNGTNPDKDPRVPGKQQSVISFLKKHTPEINVAQGDGFPSKVIFNGEECALPTELPKRNGASRARASSIFLSVLTFILVMN